ILCFQAEDGIRDFHVTGVQRVLFRSVERRPRIAVDSTWNVDRDAQGMPCCLGTKLGEQRPGKRPGEPATEQRVDQHAPAPLSLRSEERRVGKDATHLLYRVTQTIAR